MNRTLTGTSGNKRPFRLFALFAPILLFAVGGCDVMNRVFLNSLLDPTAVGRHSGDIRSIGLQRQISINDTIEGHLPRDARDPLPEDLEVRHEDYRIVPGDQLLISVFELLVAGQEAQLIRQVSDTGFIGLPRVPRLFVAGKSEQDIQQLVVSAYREAGVLRDPQVSVIAQTRFNRQASFLGPWRQPGTYNIPSARFRLLAGMGMVGDLADPTIDVIYVVRTEGDLAVLPPGIGPDAPPGPGHEPLPLPGGEPLPLPLGDNGPATPRPAGPDIPPALRDFPSGLPVPPRDGGVPGRTPGNHTAVPPVSTPRAERGHWMLVGGKWTFVTEAPPAPAPVVDGEVVPAVAPQADMPAGPITRLLRIPVGALRGGEPRYNIVLRPNDVVVAPQPVVGEFYIMGNVARPGVYSLTGRQITLLQGIVAAGGFGPLADPTKVQLIRRIPGAEVAETRSYNVGAITEANADDIVLKPYDTINVLSHPITPFLAVLRNAFRATYGVGFVYDRNFADIDSFGPRPNPRSP